MVSELGVCCLLSSTDKLLLGIWPQGHGDHIVEAAPGHLLSAHVFVNTGLVRKVQVEEPSTSHGPCVPVFPEAV